MHQRLDSWKEIAAHLRRTVRTAQRWERECGLPVHRHTHAKGHSIYAFTDELDVWWSNERVAGAEPEAAQSVSTAAPSTVTWEHSARVARAHVQVRFVVTLDGKATASGESLSGTIAAAGEAALSSIEAALRRVTRDQAGPAGRRRRTPPPAPGG